MDGHHKLIRWRMVLHGCIDGYSRMITFLHCSTNNKAQTVYNLFNEAISKYGIPRRVRTDHGTENVTVARWMLNHFGVCNKPVLTGMSVHNQRIERLWRDVHNYVVSIFSDLFYFLEGNDLLDPLDEEHLFALHYIYLPRVNQSIKQFSNQWNFHPIRTERNLSPYQLWTQGCYLFAASENTAVCDLVNGDDGVLNQHGIDDEGPPSELQTNNHVEVPQAAVILSNEHWELLLSTIDPLKEDNNYGIDNYMQTLQMIQSF